MFSRKKKTRSVDASQQPTRPAFEVLEARQLLSATTSENVQSDLVVSPLATTSSFTGYTPAEIKAAYGFNQISGDGTGQTIAIVDAYDDPNIVADLHAFDVKYGLSDTTITKVSETDGSTKNVTADAGWSEEIALDVEWAHAVAPGAKIDLVEANSDSLTDLMAAVDVARRLSGVSVVSMSWGASEFSGESYYDKYFTTPKGHEGVTFVAASGDEGSWYGPDFPATSDYVLAVGGTTLNLTSTGSYSSESGWSDSTGGVSEVEAEPGYQATVQSTGLRSSPDVSYDADPNTGFAVYDSYENSGWAVVGGTSAGAPQWAALIALADQARTAKGLGTLDSATGTLPALYKLYSSDSTYTASFHDVTSGSSSVFYSAGVGYDAVTGLGSPVATAVVSALTSATTVKLTTVSAPSTRHRSAPAVRAEVTTETTLSVTSEVQPSKPTIVYTIAPRGASAIYETLISAPQSSDLHASVTTLSPAVAPPSIFYVGATANDSSIQSTIASVNKVVELASGSAPTVTFRGLDAAANFIDASTQLATELSAMASAPIDAPMPALQTHHSTFAAGITTAAVLAADAFLIGRWCADQAQNKKRKNKPASPFRLVGLAAPGTEEI